MMAFSCCWASRATVWVGLELESAPLLEEVPLSTGLSAEVPMVVLNLSSTTGVNFNSSAKAVVRPVTVVLGVLLNTGLCLRDLGRNKFCPNSTWFNGVIPPLSVVDFSIVKGVLDLGR